jgi:two-component system chemotaxis sensor kinase CheA
MPNEEMAQYLGVFLDEATEQLELLEKDILALETGASPDLLQEIFRAAHTLKGSSRAMGYTSMGELTHAMEDVFDKLRKDEISVSTPIVDALFDSLDLLKRLLEEISSTGNSTIDTSVQTENLRALLDGVAQSETHDAIQEGTGRGVFQHAPLSETARVALQEAVNSGLQVRRLTVRIADDCVMKSVRALMVLQSLETVGSILATTPEEEAIENEEFAESFGLVLATDQPPELLRKTVLSTAEIVDVIISDPEAFPEPTAVAVPQPSAKDAPAEPVTIAQTEPSPSQTNRENPPASAESPAPSRSGSPQTQTIRVDVLRLDKLLNLVGELVIDQTRIAQVSNQLIHKYAGDEMLENLVEAASHFARITGEMQEEIMKARMLPIDNVFNRFPRMIRDIAQKMGKEIEFVVSGRETELDRSVIEVIGDPLIHLLRNSVDHGIEMPEERVKKGKQRKGTVWLRARHEENHIVIEVEDDGNGIDPEKLKASAVNKGIITAETAARMSDKEAVNLIFASGFSTAKTVSDISGRGVGMDIVKSNLTRFGAIIDVETKVGQGSKFTIKLPLTLAIIRGLLVRLASGVYVTPLASVQETMKIDRDQIHTINQREMILHRGMGLPLLRLQKLFYADVINDPLETGETETDPESLYVVVVGVAERRVGLIVDSLLGEQEIVIKSLGKFIGDIRGISGATILGDGHIALILDINGLLTIALEEKAKAYVS